MCADSAGLDRVPAVFSLSLEDDFLGDFNWLSDCDFGAAGQEIRRGAPDMVHGLALPCDGVSQGDLSPPPPRESGASCRPARSFLDRCPFCTFDNCVRYISSFLRFFVRGAFPFPCPPQVQAVFWSFWPFGRLAPGPGPAVTSSIFQSERRPAPRTTETPRPAPQIPTSLGTQTLRLGTWGCRYLGNRALHVRGVGTPRGGYTQGCT